jgi:hypothetical protein
MRKYARREEGFPPCSTPNKRKPSNARRTQSFRRPSRASVAVLIPDPSGPPVLVAKSRRDLGNNDAPPYDGRMNPRRTLRYPIEESVAARWMDHGRIRRVVGQTKDISTSGVFLHMDFQPVEVDRIELTLEFPARITGAQSSPVVCHGRVVRVEPQVLAERFGVAVEIESCEDLAPAT